MPNKAAIEYVGHRFGKLRVLAVAKSNGLRSRLLCWCDCGSKHVAFTSSIKTGTTKSCGCIRRKRAGDLTRTHGHAYLNGKPTKEYTAWRAMKSRCNLPGDISYRNYGGRGIRVCEEWQDSFETFLRDVGAAPSRFHSIDRIDHNGHYGPDNTRWATQKEQCNNKRNNTMLTHDGVTLTATEWAQRVGFGGPEPIYNRLADGWSVERALLTPIRHKRTS